MTRIRYIEPVDSNLYEERRKKLLQKIASKWVSFILLSLKKICGVTWSIKGLENIPDKPCILVSNHQGAWESFFIQTLYFPSSSIVKRELLFIPFFGWALACLKPCLLYTSDAADE